MYPTVPIALFGWPLVVIILFTLIPPRRAVLIAFLGAWLFLPEAHFKIPGIPDYSKLIATGFGAFLGAILFDTGRLFAFRLRWMDIPMIIWCICPLFSSLSNGLGLHDGISATLYQILDWGLPYLIGRLYFDDLNGLRELAIGIVMGGLLYVPLCLLEMQLSPQLHQWVYGFTPSAFGMTKRGDGYRPLVFMQTGLTVGLWMAAASLISIWFWVTGAVKRVGSMPIHWTTLSILVTAILCKSSGAICILLIGLIVLFTSRKFKSVLPLYCLVGLIPLYIGFRIENIVSPDTVASELNNFFGNDRVASMMFRMNNEVKLSDKAWKRPVFGWGGWNRSSILDDAGHMISTSDSLWIIAFGKTGIVGLASLFTAFLLPAALVWRAYPPLAGADPRLIPLRLLSLLVVLYAIDCVCNAMINPIYILAMGGIAGVRLRPMRKKQALRRVASRVPRYSVAPSA